MWGPKGVWFPGGIIEGSCSESFGLLSLYNDKHSNDLYLASYTIGRIAHLIVSCCSNAQHDGGNGQVAVVDLQYSAKYEKHLAAEYNSVEVVVPATD